MNEKKIARLFKAFSDENRVKILQILLEEKECCACELLRKLNITQPTLSHHMRILCDSEVVLGNKNGKWIHYTISKEGMTMAQDYLRQFDK